MSKHETFTLPSTNPAAIDALSVAVEFLSCAIRAAAWGADPQSDDVRKPVAWANAKIAEAVHALEGR